MGNAIVAALISSFPVIAVDKNRAALAKLAGRHAKKGKRLTLCLADLGSAAGIAKAARAAQEPLGWIVHTAGFIDKKESMKNLKQKTIEETFAVNLFSYMRLTSILLPKLKGGAIVISSTAGLWGNPEFPAYAVSKGAVNTFTEVLAHSFEGGGRRAIAICPGPTNTNMRERIARDAAKQQSPDVIAALVSTIIKEKHYKNGDIVSVRGGKRRIVGRLT